MTVDAAPAGLARVRRAWFAREIPYSVHLEVTYSCTWRCAFCYNPRKHDIAPLGLAEWEAVLDDLRVLGTLFVTFTGGEPLVHPEFFAIARAARARSMAIRILTNGSRIDDAAITELSELSPVSIALSLHGASAEIHERTTGVPGSFQATLGAIERLRSVGISVNLKAPVTAINEREIAALAALAAGLGLDLRLDPSLVPRDFCGPSPVCWRASRDGVRDAVRVVRQAGSLKPRLSDRGEPVCSVGRTTLAVDPEGNVFPCIAWRRECMGNVRQTPLRELWPGSEIRKRARAAALRAGQRLVDEALADSPVPYCPALAAALTGDPACPSETFREYTRIAAEIGEHPCE